MPGFQRRQRHTVSRALSALLILSGSWASMTCFSLKLPKVEPTPTTITYILAHTLSAANGVPPSEVRVETLHRNPSDASRNRHLAVEFSNPLAEELAPLDSLQTQRDVVSAAAQLLVATTPDSDFLISGSEYKGVFDRRVNFAHRAPPGQVAAENKYRASVLAHLRSRFDGAWDTSLLQPNSSGAYIGVRADGVEATTTKTQTFNSTWGNGPEAADQAAAQFARTLRQVQSGARLGALLIVAGNATHRFIAIPKLGGHYPDIGVTKHRHDWLLQRMRPSVMERWRAIGGPVTEDVADRGLGLAAEVNDHIYRIMRWVRNWQFDQDVDDQVASLGLWPLFRASVEHLRTTLPLSASTASRYVLTAHGEEGAYAEIMATYLSAKHNVQVPTILFGASGTRCMSEQISFSRDAIPDLRRPDGSLPPLDHITVYQDVTDVLAWHDYHAGGQVCRYGGYDLFDRSAFAFCEKLVGYTGGELYLTRESELNNCKYFANDLMTILEATLNTTSWINSDGTTADECIPALPSTIDPVTRAQRFRDGLGDPQVLCPSGNLPANFIILISIIFFAPAAFVAISFLVGLRIFYIVACTRCLCCYKKPDERAAMTLCCWPAWCCLCCLRGRRRAACRQCMASYCCCYSWPYGNCARRRVILGDEYENAALIVRKARVANAEDVLPPQHKYVDEIEGLDDI